MEERIIRFDNIVQEAQREQNDQTAVKIKTLLKEYNFEPSFLLRLYNKYKNVLYTKPNYYSDSVGIYLLRSGHARPIIEKAIKLEDIDLLCHLSSFSGHYTYTNPIHFSYDDGPIIYKICFEKGRSDLFRTVLAKIKEQMGDTPDSFENMYNSAIKNIDIVTIKKLIELGYRYYYYNSLYSRDSVETRITFVFNEIFTNQVYLPLISEFCTQLFRVTPIQLFRTFGPMFKPYDREQMPVAPITREQMNMFDYVLSQFPMDLTESDSYGNNILFNIIHFKRDDASCRILFKKLIERDPRLRSMFSFHECKIVPSEMELEYYFNMTDCIASLLNFDINTIDADTGKTLIQKFLSPKKNEHPDMMGHIEFKPQLFINVSSCIAWFLSHLKNKYKEVLFLSFLNHIDNLGNTALFYACLHNSIPLLSLLIKNGATLTQEMLERLTTENLWPEGSHGEILPDLDGTEPVRIPAPPRRYQGYMTITQTVYNFMHSKEVLRRIFETEAQVALSGLGDISKIPDSIIFNRVLTFLSGADGTRDLEQIKANTIKRTLRREETVPKSPSVMSFTETQDAIESLRALLTERIQNEPPKPLVIRDGDAMPEPPIMGEPIHTRFGTFFNNTQIAEYIEALRENLSEIEKSDMFKVDGTKIRRKEKRRTCTKRRFSKKRI